MTRFKEPMARSVFPISAIAALAILSLVSIHLSVYADGNQEFGASDIYKTNYVKFGTTITFHNTDSQPHDITGTDSQGNIVTSGIVQPDQTTELIFTKIGVFDFYDTLNPNKQGTIEIYNSLSDMQTFSASTNGYAYKSSPTFYLLGQVPVVNQPTDNPPVIQQTSPPVDNQTTTNSTSTNSTNTSPPATTNSTATNTVTVTQADIKTLNDKIDALNAKIDSMNTLQNEIFGGLQKLLRIFNLS